jgi:hypothetical protein
MSALNWILSAPRLLASRTCASPVCWGASRVGLSTCSRECAACCRYSVGCLSGPAVKTIGATGVVGRIVVTTSGRAHPHSA